MGETNADGMYQPSKYELIGLGVASGILAWTGNLFGQACDAADYGILSVALATDETLDGFVSALATNPLGVSGDLTPLCLTGLGVIVPWLALWALKYKGNRDYMFNKEHGTARWGTRAEAKRFEDETDEYNNIILSATERKALVPKKFDLETDRNNNVLLIGGPGTGKTRYNIKPNLMQLNSSYVVTDPKGTLVPECAQMFAGEYDDSGKRSVPDDCKYRTTRDLYAYDRATGTKRLIAHAGELVPYEVRVLNLINFDKSHKYNPLAYMKTEKDILKLVNVFMQNTNGEGAQKGEDFWVKAEQLFYTAIFSYLYFEYPPEKRTFAQVVNMVDMAKVKEEDEDYKSALDILFEELETGKRYDVRKGEYVKFAEPRPNHFAVRQYKKYKQAAGKTAKSILISCSARLAPFDIDALRDLLSADELELDRIGDRPTVLFVIIPDTDTTFSFIAAMCFYQMFNLLTDHADDECGGKLDIPVQCLFDEFANIGRLPGMSNLVTTLRSRGVSLEIVLQNLGQLDRDYDKAARIIKGGCDTMLYLGGGDPETCKEISERLGKRTIANRSVTVNNGQQKSTNVNDQLIARDLLDPSEVERMPRAECIVQIGGMFAFKSKKYKLESHPRYKWIDPGHPGAACETLFDAADYIKAMRGDKKRGGRKTGLKRSVSTTPAVRKPQKRCVVQTAEVASAISGTCRRSAAVIEFTN